MKYRVFIWVLLIIGCEETFVSDEITTTEGFLVVEGLITNENKSHRIRLSRPYQELNTSPEPVTGAVVVIVQNEDPVVLSEDPENPGNYLTPPFRALFGKVYTLAIFLEGQEYYAQAAANFGEPIKPLSYSMTEDSLYRFDYQESDNPSMMEVQAVWEEDQTTQSLGRYFTLNVVDVNRIFAPGKEEFLFPTGSMIIRKQFSLSEQHQEFLRSYLSEVDWRGGGFDVAPGNVITNLTNGAKGFFGVSMVSIDTTIVD